MSFNPDPTKQAAQVIFSRKAQATHHPKIYLNDIEAKTVDEHKHFGLTLEAKLTFASHIDEKNKKARQVLHILKTVSRYLLVKTLEQVYKMYIRPRLDFRDVIYHITGTWEGTSSKYNL